jgi:o-succinylbenzoate synthase
MGAEVSTSRANWRKRRSLALYLEDLAGTTGRGEASPLPGYSSDTIDQCRTALERINWLAERPPSPLPPAAQFALDMALLDLRSLREQRPAWSLLLNETPDRVPLCTVLHERDPIALGEEIQQALDAGYRSFKLKIGAEAHRDLTRCRIVRRAAASSEIRLDANRAWDSLQARQQLEPYRELGCAFVEEPSSDLVIERDPDAIVRLCESLPLPVALDESLQRAGVVSALGAVLPRAPLGALVLKPMALGGIEVTRTLAELGHTHGVPVVLSHLFDGPLALAASGVLALAFGSESTAAGLAPHPGLDAWPPAPLPGFDRGWLAPWDTPGLAA